MYFFGDTYFPEALVKNAFQMMFFIILITEISILLLTTWSSRKKSEEKKKQDRGSMLFMITGYWAAIFLNPICVHFMPFILPLNLFWVGAAFVMLGIFVRVYSVWTLRKFFTLNVQIASKQELIRNGPYKYIRHPAYTGSILTLLGAAFSFRSPFGLVATAIIVIVIYGYRIRIEERLLEESFGEVYKSYEKETWRLVPHIW